MQRLQGFVEAGNTTLTISGAAGTIARKVQGSFPSATITVYLAGTLDLATLYADNAGTSKANPFTSSSSGIWFFYAGNGRYDVQFSGGGISTPFTLGDFVLFDEGILIIDSTDTQYAGGVLGPTPAAALQAAIDSVAPGSGANIVLPPGTISMEATVEMNGRLIHLRGSGRESTILYWPENDMDGIIIDDGCIISDLTIRGPDTATIPGWTGIDGAADNVELRNIIVENWGSHGINTAGGSTNWLIHGCIVRNNHEDDGILVGGGSTRIVIDSNWFYGNGAWGVDLNGSRNSVVNNKIFLNGVEQGGSDSGGIAVFGYTDGALLYPADENIIEGNTVFGNTGEQIWLLSNTGTTANNNQIKNNEFSDGTSHGIKIGGGSGEQIGTKIEGNVSKDNVGRGIFLQLGTSDMEETEIRHNRCVGNEYGIVIEAGCLDTQVSDNVFLNNSNTNLFDQGTNTTKSGNKTSIIDGNFDIDSATDIVGGVNITGPIINIQGNNFANGDTTPSVSAASIFTPNNAAPTTITDFDNGATNQLLTIIASENNTTIQSGGNLTMRSTFPMRANDAIGYYRSGGLWFELFRSAARATFPQNSFADSDATPSVVAGNVFATANTGATSITDFDDGIAGQPILIIASDNNTTILDAGNLSMAGNFVMTAGDVIAFYRSGTTWYELFRSNNT